MSHLLIVSQEDEPSDQEASNPEDVRKVDSLDSSCERDLSECCRHDELDRDPEGTLLLRCSEPGAGYISVGALPTGTCGTHHSTLRRHVRVIMGAHRLSQSAHWIHSC